MIFEVQKKARIKEVSLGGKEGGGSETYQVVMPKNAKLDVNIGMKNYYLQAQIENSRVGGKEVFWVHLGSVNEETDDTARTLATARVDEKRGNRTEAC